MKLVLLFATVSMIADPSITALAGGAQVSRIATNARIGIRSVVDGCPGKIFEEFSENGNVHGGGSSLTLICATSGSTAAWVLLSGAGCYDQSENVPSYCGAREAAAVPRFETTDYENRQPPFVARYNLVRYGLGRDCAVVTQSVTMYPRPGRPSLSKTWLCKKLDFFNGSAGAVHAWDLKSIPVETGAPYERVMIGSPKGSSVAGFELQYPQTFIAPEGWYNYTYKPNE